MSRETEANRTVKIWQWNCRGFKRKRPELQLLVQTLEFPPDVIALREAGTNVKLPGYKAFQDS